ncbi:MAG TPA: hypothetical protein VK453_25160 [Micromonosporaceae bacterium]|nr:hypothetical protein [Micromonosporaceae bacterium]
MTATVSPAAGTGSPVLAAGPRKPVKRRPKPVVDTTAPVSFAVEAGTDGMRVWTLRFPAPDRMLSVNSGHQHWRKTGPVHKTWRESMFTYARYARLPQCLPRVRVEFELRFPTHGRKDAGNYYTHVVKPCVDALGPPIDKMRAGKRVVAAGHGLIADDTAEYLDGPFVRLGAKVTDPKRCPFGEVVVTITELAGT